MTFTTHQSATTLKLHTKVILAFVALVLLNLSSIPPQSLSWHANASLHRHDRLEFWPQAKSLLVSLKQKYSNKLGAVTQLAQAHYEELSLKSFKIVKVESRRIESSFIWPVTGRITSGFGMRNHPITRVRSFHNGVDIRARRGTEILSPVEGTVITASHAGLLGRLVRIRTNDGLILYMGHMQKIKCVKGQQIKRGQVVGTIGSSGRATGPHLHFSVKSGGKYVNPMQYLSSN